MSVILVALGAALGAPLRYLVDRAVQARHGSAFPWGTFTVNVVGSFILGVLIGGAAVGAVPGSLVALLGVGLCGALTTYSTFGYETVRLFEAGRRFHALFNAGASVVAALGAAFVGVALAEALWS
ncbi:CrcB protein [Micromonospora phaseoli]|uniref:Fluoride-specific ion channel FluC n=1 Tax=Micromonospora phaseoli TaxID=1144548 RepID=A0A1H7AHL6_9ACTN|nr:fluoride efflux transporter CrcB [Micromonospora phaseoli]PZV96454.1 camphor resistance protein CrcB [Micromonospora phaseoli]GIJ76142.1 putative fluoride ion transporter CrcB 2 [Micromonospora phaseoli]SEJ63387.1 CrcB protein [Micromonospora phaseoli]